MQMLVVGSDLQADLEFFRRQERFKFEQAFWRDFRTMSLMTFVVVPATNVDLDMAV